MGLYHISELEMNMLAMRFCALVVLHVQVLQKMNRPTQSAQKPKVR